MEKKSEEPQQIIHIEPNDTEVREIVSFKPEDVFQGMEGRIRYGWRLVVSHLRQDAHHTQDCSKSTDENGRPDTSGQSRERTTTVEGSIVGTAGLCARVILSTSASAGQVGAVRL